MTALMKMRESRHADRPDHKGQANQDDEMVQDFSAEKKWHGPKPVPLGDVCICRGYRARNGMMSRATMLTTFIIGLMAGPAVSL